VLRIEFWFGNLKERDYLEDQVVYGNIILKWILKKYGGIVGWIYPVQERQKLEFLVKAMKKIWFHGMPGIS